MPRGKRSGRRGNGRVAPPRQFQASSVPLASPSGRHVLTMEEEARNTERHNRCTGLDTRLRDTKVSFVSAGPVGHMEAKDSEELEVDDPQRAMESMSLGEPWKDSQSEIVAHKQISLSDEARPIMDMEDHGPHLRNPVSREGRGKGQEGLSSARQRIEASPTPSNSSEEVILFRGRFSQAKTSPPIDERIKSIENEIHKKEAQLTSLHNGRPSSLVHQKPQGSVPTRAESSKRSYPRRGGRHRKARAQDENEEAVIADYIANMDKDDAIIGDTVFKRDLGAAQDSAWRGKSDEFSVGVNDNARKAIEVGWDHSHASDLDDMSTSNAIMGDVQAVLSKRTRRAVLQYLIVWEGQSKDEARWVPAKSLIGQPATRLIEIFEAEAKLIAQLEDSDGSTDSDESDDDSVDEEDEQDLVQRKIDHMTDEELARLLSKQEELGLGSDEVVLFDGFLSAHEHDEPAIVRDTYIPFKLSAKNRTAKPRGGKRRQDEFPSASALADAYDGFDVMDFDRPSLKKKPKGRRGKLAFDLSDSELEASMEMAWNNDRLKKKERKEEREKLRQQGLLGGKGDKPDLKQKYKEGMGIDAVKEEIRNFLMSENTTLALPPMDKADRKVVHELANAFNLKSKSVGNGNTRFPVLYRTKRTSRYTDHVFDSVEARLKRRYLPRMDVKGRSGRTGGGGVNNAAVSYRDGDIVGASAPVLGIENRGRAMLEKMGWSSGTALGALNNKGILEPVSHVVKTTKAGLG